jgi:hypothetical protein
MVFFGYHKHKQKTKTFAWQHFGTQSSLWVKINLDPKIRWKELDKLMYIQYITYKFLTTVGPHVCDSWNITKQKRIICNAMPIYKISSSLIW